jgi:hypothetical protein
MMAGRRKKDTIFAIVRLDSDDVAESQVTVKEIVSTEEGAIAEVERLNAARRDNSYRYVWQATRWIELGD